MALGIWDKLRAAVTGIAPLDRLPDNRELSDAAADRLVGSIDTAEPVELVEGDPAEVAALPEGDEAWDISVHEEEYADDPLVTVTEDPEDGSHKNDPSQAPQHMKER